MPQGGGHLKAILLNEYGGADKLRYVEDAPEPEVQPDEVLVATAAASIYPIDYKLRSGALQTRMPWELPAILGFDASGVVRTVSADVTGFHPGDRVIAMARRTQASLVTVKARTVTRLPEGADLVDAAALPLVCMTGEQLIREICKLENGQTVLITGATGDVGRAAGLQRRAALARSCCSRRSRME